MTRSRNGTGRHVVRGRAAPALGVAAGMLVLALPGPVLAAEGAGLITVNASLIIQIVNFLILLAVLYRFLYRPLVGALEGRSAAIKQQLAEAQAAREEAQRQLADFETRLRASQAEAQKAREQALREAAETRERLTAEARAEASRLVESAQAQIAQEVRRAKAELRQEVGQHAIQIAERLIKKSLRDDDHQRLVDEALAQIDRRS